MKRICLFLAFFTLAACTPEPRPINYGHDACVFCKMTVVSKQHAAEAVTSKWKGFTFDAIECMVNYVQQQTETEFAFLLVNDFLQPEELIDARTAHFLISEKMPSPMGAFLSAYEKREAALEMQQSRTGALFTWNELNRHFKKAGLNYYE